MARRKKLGELLVDGDVVSYKQVQRALTDAGLHGRIGERLIAHGVADEISIARALAAQFGLPFFDPAAQPFDASLIEKLPKPMVAARSVLPISFDGKVLRVAVSDPLNLSLTDDLRFLFRARVKVMVSTPSALWQAYDLGNALAPHAHRMLSGARPGNALDSNTVHALDAAEIVQRLESGGQRPYVDLASLLIVHAAQQGASDIHLEPQADGMRVRFRVDGMLRQMMTLPPWSSAPLVSRIKVLAELDVANRRAPQDGKFRVTVDGRRIDLRVAVVPSQFGEKVVARLLDPRMLQIDLGTLGWAPHMLQSYYQMVSRPRGLVLTVGPTGSGKTTTLYATIHRLRTETASVVTIEDPIEYTLDGIVQLEVDEKAGMTFATSIRSILRQDANVVVVGEIRDPETALAAVQATTTGHLVLSTLHTTQAVSTIVRLLELGVPPYLLGDALSGIVAQRLVRRVCPECSVVAAPQPEDWERFGIPPETLGPGVRRAGAGCEACHFTGFKGRVGIFEVLPITDALRTLVLDGAGERALWTQARQEGMTTLFDDALAKVSAGQTTLEEVARVVPVDPWRSAEIPLPTKAAAPAPEPPPVLTPAPAQPVVLGRPQVPDAATVPAAPMVAVHDPEQHLLDALPTPTPIFTDLPESDEDAASASDGRPLVLVVDDAAEIRDLVSISLEDDYRIVTAADGVAALEAVARHGPDLVVLDVMMPLMSGYEVCERLKADAATADLPIIILSARGQRGHVKEGLRRGADDYLPKPFDPEELALRVRALLRRSGR